MRPWPEIYFKLLFVCGLGLVGLGLCLGLARPGKLRLSIQFLGYTNIPDYGTHVGVLQISNASPFTVVRGRDPQVVYRSPAVPASYAPTGWRVLRPGEAEVVLTESITNGIGWRFVLRGERLGGDSECIAPEPRLRCWHRRVASWLNARGVPAREPSPQPIIDFSTDWIGP